MKIMQIILDRKPVRQSREFLGKLWNSPNIEGARIFDMLDGTQLRRRENNGMTLEKYLSLDWRSRHIRLQIGSPFESRIVYFAGVYYKEGVQHFALIYFP